MNGEVLNSESEKNGRFKYLRWATTLGNIEKYKVRICFKPDHNEIYTVDTTIWGITDEHVILKSRNVIPIERITEVKLW